MTEKVITVQINEINYGDYPGRIPPVELIPHPELNTALRDGYKVVEIVDATPKDINHSIIIFHLEKG
ncbi:hypothetical protein [Xanthocytophaga agilis]|uniref:Uncharacterized protein n=1 Tax=Xanthocytophaga agilis TaxID=3048010 RepID=A0AAE3R793_9BACT|nr:hypothetical protein [Xanthocytophaga agilis]MDJ1502744.1 hypothetical protein [Xanthocytophaga agilis]